VSEPRTSDRNVDRVIRSWLHEDRHEDVSRVAGAVLDLLDTTPQRRSPWRPARRIPFMNNFAKVLVATAAVVAVAAVAINVLPGTGGGTGSVPTTPSMSPTPEPSMSPTPEPTASLVTHALTPFGPRGFDDENPRAASITFTIDAPASWEKFEEIGLWIEGNRPPDGADLMFLPAGGLFSDPCLTEEKADAAADIPVGPTVDDLVTALVDHPSLDVTSPVDVTLAGFSGKYLDLQIPDNISACAYYKPMDGHHYAQGPGQRWHMWVLDVGGVRVLVETNDYPGTPPERLAEEQAIIDSLEINP
jgi:hypothetical protein